LEADISVFGVKIVVDEVPRRVAGESGGVIARIEQIAASQRARLQ